MEAFIHRLERSTLWQAVIYFVLGVLILLYPRFFFDVMVYVIAGYLAIMGIWMIFQGMRRRQGGLPPAFFMGVIYLILAAIVFFFAETLASLLPILIGSLFLFGGVIRLIQALGYRQSMAGRWFGFLFGSLLWIGFGIRPLGPSTLPRRPTIPIMSGLATTTSKSNQFSPWIFWTSSMPPA